MKTILPHYSTILGGRGRAGHLPADMADKVGMLMGQSSLAASASGGAV